MRLVHVFTLPLIFFLLFSAPTLSSVYAEETIIGSQEVPASEYDASIGVVISDPGNIYDSFLGGATLIDENSILSAGHVLAHLSESDLYFVANCRNLKNCKEGTIRKITEALLFDDPGSNWDSADPDDVAVGTLSEPITQYGYVTLPTHDMSSQDPILVRGNGCLVVNGVTAEVQHQAVIQHLTKQGNELKFNDPNKKSICPGDSGSLMGVKLPEKIVQTGINVRWGVGVSTAESIWQYKARIEDCMDAQCPEIRILPPSVKLQDDAYVAFEATTVMVGTPGVLSNDIGNTLRISSLGCWDVGEDDSSTIVCASDGSFTFNPGQLKAGAVTVYGYQACDLNANCKTARISLRVVSSDNAVYLPVIIY